MSEQDKNNEKPRSTLEEIRFAELNKMEKFQIFQIIMEKDKIIKELKAKLRVCSLELEKCKNQKKEPKQKIVPFRYDPELTGIEKVMLILSHTAKIMTASQMKDKFRQLEPQRIRAWRKRLSAVEKYLSRAVKYQKIIKYRFPGSKFFYALPDWFDAEGKLIKSYASA